MKGRGGSFGPALGVSASDPKEIVAVAAAVVAAVVVAAVAVPDAVVAPPREPPWVRAREHAAGSRSPAWLLAATA